MSVQFSDLARIAGITILITLGWAATIAFTFWDTHNRHISGGKTFTWLVIVALLPLFGFFIYIGSRTLTTILSLRIKGTDLKTRRETALKPPPARRHPMPTLIAADLGKQTILNPNKPVPAKVYPNVTTIKCIFTVSNGPDSGLEFDLSDFPVKIGRGSFATIGLDGDLSVSREQAEIYVPENSLRIRDLKSAHGTYVNGVRIEDSILESGDQIQVGSTVLVVKIILE